MDNALVVNEKAFHASSLASIAEVAAYVSTWLTGLTSYVIAGGFSSSRRLLQH